MKNLSLAIALTSAVLLPGCASAPQHIAGANPDLPFSNGVYVANALFVGGHLGLDPGTGAPPDDPAEEVRLLLDSFEVTLGEAGMTMDDLVQVQVFCSDLGLYDVFNAEYRTRFDGSFPARAFLGSGDLLFGARFEMLGIARGR